MEINFDGIIGPTHNYSGLSYGNRASMEHDAFLSNPRQAALQGLEKMKILMDLGVKQAVLPPQERPFIPFLHALGFYGSEAEILEKGWKTDPKLVMACGSAASMWAANSATVSPSTDSLDKRVHFTPANLLNKLHRSFEAPITAHVLMRIFDNPAYFAHHYPLPYHQEFSDEGAANHTRLCKTHEEAGIQLFVYGSSYCLPDERAPKKFPARQTKEASEAVARLHRLFPERTLFAKQHPDAIDAGVFHNDVISTGNQNVFLFHERAFLNTEETIDQLQRLMEIHCHTPLIAIQVKEKEISLEEAVKTYLFNSQLITLPDHSMALLAPQECRLSASVHSFLQNLIKDKSQPIRQVLYQDIRESMQNGGGPACLRLRVVLNKDEYAAMHPGVILTNKLYDQLVKWVHKHYRDQLLPKDLADHTLLQESMHALDELTSLLDLGPIYSFQHRRPLPPLPKLRS